MNELINKVYKEKLEDGTIEQLISANIEKLVNDCCNDLFNYNGTIKKQMEKKIEEVMSDVVEKSDLSKYVIKMQTLINETLPNTALVDYKQFAKNVSKIAGAKMPKYNEKIKLSDIFQKYCDLLNNETFSEIDIEDEIENDGEGRYIDTTCKCELIDDDVVEFSVEGLSDYESKKWNFKLKLCKWNDGSYTLRVDKTHTLSDLRYMGEFELYLQMLSHVNAYINLDKTHLEEELYITIEE